MHRFDRCTTWPGRAVWLQARLRLVLEGHPAVAGLRQRSHHPRVQLARLDRLASPGPALRPARRRARTPRRTGRASCGTVLRIEQRPVAVRLDALHEQVGDPVGEVEVVRAARLVAGVVAQLEELLDVGVPRLQVHAGRALALAALVHRRHRGIERLQPRHDAVASGRWWSRSASRASARGGRPRPMPPENFDSSATSLVALRRCAPACPPASRAGSSSTAARGACRR